MEEKFKTAVENYQCSGCTLGSGISCFKASQYGDKGCGSQSSGTFVSGAGKVFLGMPRGFNRIGRDEATKIHIFDKFEEGFGYDIFNVPVWKHLDEYGNTLVRGFCPRSNYSWIHVFLENCIDKINCIEITPELMEEID